MESFVAIFEKLNEVRRLKEQHLRAVGDSVAKENNEIESLEPDPKALEILEDDDENIL